MSKSVVGITAATLLALLVTGCDSQEQPPIEEVVTDEVVAREKAAENKSPIPKAELEDRLRQRYGDIEQSQSLWALTDTGSEGTFVYKLSDGRTIQIDGYANRNLEYFVDPAFDFSTLPTP